MVAVFCPGQRVRVCLSALMLVAVHDFCTCTHMFIPVIRPPPRTSIAPRTNLGMRQISRENAQSRNSSSTTADCFTRIAVSLSLARVWRLIYYRNSVCPSVCHISDTCLNGSRYRDVIYTTQCVDAWGLLLYRVWRYDAVVWTQ